MVKDIKTVILGAGSRAKVVTYILEEQGCNILGYASSEPRGTKLNGYEVLCTIEELLENPSEIGAEAVFVAIGDNVYRKNIIEKVQHLGLTFINAIHPSAIISDKSKFGKGVYIDAGTVIHPDVTIEDYVAVGSNALIGHDCMIKSHVTIGPGALVCGNVTMNELSVASVGSIIIEKVSVGANSIVGAGSVVTRDVEEDSVMIGSPAKFLRKRDKDKSYLR